MDINTRLDGFIVHPLDAFNDHHHEDDIPKFSSTAPHLDGFQVHPLDSFISHEHNNDISNDYLNFNDTNQINTNYLSTNTFTIIYYLIIILLIRLYINQNKFQI